MRGPLTSLAHGVSVSGTIKLVTPSRSPMEEAVLPGGYSLRERIGEGGLATVYRAEHPRLARSVAVKLLHPHLIHDEDVSRRFRNEARMANRLHHPHVVSVLDFGTAATGQPYIVSELVRGRDLALVMHEHGPLGFRRIIDILSQVLDALGEAHRQQIIHGDVKPGNVLVTRACDGSDFARITDFGLAVRLDDASPTPPHESATVFGTPDFMSPEQCRGELLDARSDLYSVGAMLYLLLTEHLPFQAESPSIVLQMQVSAPLKDPLEVAPRRGIPKQLADIASKALAKPPDDRFQNAEEFIEALCGARRGLAR
jgi:serine/threonine protein kinase